MNKNDTVATRSFAPLWTTSQSYFTRQLYFDNLSGISEFHHRSQQLESGATKFPICIGVPPSLELLTPGTDYQVVCYAAEEKYFYQGEIETSSYLIVYH